MADSDNLEEMARAAAKRHNIPADWFVSLIRDGEGGFRNPKGVSPKGAAGVGQLMPQTAADVGVSDRQDPSQNIEGAAIYASQMYRKFGGNAKLATAAYNAGPANAERHGEDLVSYPVAKETKPYVERVQMPTADEILDAQRPPTADEILDGKAPAGSAQSYADEAARDAAQSRTFAERSQQEAAAAKPRKGPTPLQRATQAGEQFGHVGAEAQHQQEAATRGVIADVTNTQRSPAQIATDIAAPTGRAASDLFSLAGGGAISGAFKAAVGDPVVNTLKAVTGGKDPVSVVTGGKFSLDPQAVGDVASMLIPGAGEFAGERALATRAGEAGVGANTLRAAEAGRARLAAATPSTAVSAPPSPYYRGMAPPKFNRTVYNDALSEIGENYPANGPVGHQGVNAVGERFSNAYRTALRRVTVKDDTQLTGDLVQAGADLKGKPQEGEFDRIVRDDVITKFEKGGISGNAWQSVRSDLKRQARSLAKSQDPNQQALGRSLTKVSQALRSALDRSAPPAVGKRIDQIDRGFAKLVRIEDAAGRAAKQGGVFKPEQLLASEQSQVGRRAMGRGEGLMQSQARTAYAPKPSMTGRVVGGLAGSVIGSHIPVVGPLIGEGVGAAVGAMMPDAANLARSVLARHVARTNGPNYLARVTRHTRLPPP